MTKASASKYIIIFANHLKMSLNQLSININKIPQKGGIPVTSGFYLSVDPNTREIIYIGEAINLSRRIRALKKALTTGIYKHSGGSTIFHNYRKGIDNYEIVYYETKTIQVAKMFERYLLYKCGYLAGTKKPTVGNKI